MHKKTEKIGSLILKITLTLSYSLKISKYMTRSPVCLLISHSFLICIFATRLKLFVEMLWLT